MAPGLPVLWTLSSSFSLPKSHISANSTETSPGVALSQGGPARAARGHKGGLWVTRMPDEDAYNASCPFWADGLEYLWVPTPPLQGGVTRRLQGATERKREQRPGVRATEERNRGAGLPASRAGTQSSRRGRAPQVLPKPLTHLDPPARI